MNGIIVEFGSFLKEKNVSELTKCTNIKELSEVCISPEVMLPYLEFVILHKRMFKIYQTQKPLFNYFEKDTTLNEKVFVPVYNSLGIYDKELIGYLSNFYLSGISAIIQMWVANDCDKPIEYIYKTIRHCILRNEEEAQGT